MTHDEFTEGVNTIARKKLKLSSLISEREQLIAEIHERFKAEQETLEHEIKTLNNACHKHARDHRAEIFGTEKKSAETPLAVFSLYQGPPSLKPMSRMTWAKIYELVQELEEHKYIAWVPELNREQIKSDMLRKNWNKDPKLGVRIVRDESFNVQPKKK